MDYPKPTAEAVHAFKPNTDKDPNARRSNKRSVPGADGPFRQTVHVPGTVMQLAPRKSMLERTAHPVVCGTGTDMPFSFVDMPDDNQRMVREMFPAGVDPTYAVRACLVFTVPARMLQPAAESWGDFSLCDVKEAGVLSSFSFFTHAVSLAVTRDHAQVFTFVEPILADPGPLPLCTGPSAAQLDPKAPPYFSDQRLRAEVMYRDNIVGFRMFALLGLGSFGAETTFRRALFDLQEKSGQFTTGPERRALGLDWKLYFLNIQDAQRRAAAISEYARACAILYDREHRSKAAGGGGGGGGGGGRKKKRDINKAKPPAKKQAGAAAAAAVAGPVSFADDEADGGNGNSLRDDEDDRGDADNPDPISNPDAQDDDGDDGDDDRANDSELVKADMERLEERIYRLIRTPLSPELRAQYEGSTPTDQRTCHLPVCTLKSYVQRVLEPPRFYSRTYKLELFGAAAAYYSADWCDMADLRMACPNNYLGVEETFSFDVSRQTMNAAASMSLNEAALAKIAGSERGVASPQTRACAFQLNHELYFGDDDNTFHFPFPHVAWSVDPSNLSPPLFMNTIFPWVCSQFEDAMMELSSCTEAVAADAARASEQKSASVSAHTHLTPLLTSERAATILPMHRNTATAEERHPYEAMKLITDGNERRSFAYLTKIAQCARIDHALARDDEQHQVREHKACNALELDVKRSLFELVDRGNSERQFELACHEGLALDLVTLHEKETFWKKQVSFLGGPGGDQTQQHHHIEIALLPLANTYNAKWRAVEAMCAVLPPPHADYPPDEVETFRYVKRCEMHRLMCIDLLDKVLSLLSAGVDINQLHASMYEELCRMGKLAFVRFFSPVPRMSITSNATVARMLDLQKHCGLQNGSLDFQYGRLCDLQASKLEIEAPMNNIIVASPASGKSLIFTLLENAALKGTRMSQGHNSRLADHTRTLSGGNQVRASDEGGQAIQEHTKHFQRMDPDAVAAKKQALSQDCISFSRYNKEDGEREQTISITKRMPVVYQFAVNGMHIEKDADMALLTRGDIAVWCQMRGRIEMIDRAADLNTERRRALFHRMCEVYRSEQAVNTFLVLSVRMGLINSFDLNMLRVAQAEGIKSVQRWFLSFSSDMRMLLRAIEYAALSVYMTAHYKVFQSEASELLLFDAEFAELRGAEPAYVSHLARLMGPYLYATQEHANLMLTRMMSNSFPFEFYWVLRTLASTEARFKRGEFAQFYRRLGVDVIDDAVNEVARERHEPELPLWIRQLISGEMELDHRVNANPRNADHVREQHEGNARCPVFAYVNLDDDDDDSNNSGGGGGGDKNGGFARGRGGARGAASVIPSMSESAAGNNNKRRLIDPNWVALGMSVEALTHVTERRMSDEMEVDTNVLRAMFQLMTVSRNAVRGPVFELIEHPVERNELCFSHLRPRYEPNTNRIFYEVRPILRQVPMVDGRGGRRHEAQINVNALMAPPQFLLYLMLSSMENKFTRQRETVLPLEVWGEPGVLHAWTVKPRPGVTLSSVNVTGLTSITRTRFEHAEGASTELNKLAEKCFSFAHEDPEVTFFRQHMRKLYQAPDYRDWLAGIEREPDGAEIIRRHDLQLGPSGYPTKRQFDYLFEHWTCAHHAYPGRAERVRDSLYDTAPVFDTIATKAARAAHYPDTELERSEMEIGILRMLQTRRVTPLYKQCATIDLANLDNAKQFIQATRYRLFSSLWFDTVRELHAHTPRRLAVIEDSCQRLFGTRALPPASIEPPAAVAAYVTDNIEFLRVFSSNHLDLVAMADAYDRHLHAVETAALLRGDPDDIGAAQDLVTSGTRTDELECTARQLSAARTKIRPAHKPKQPQPPRVLLAACAAAADLDDAMDVDADADADAPDPVTDAEEIMLRMFGQVRALTRRVRAIAYCDLVERCQHAVRFINEQKQRTDHIGAAPIRRALTDARTAHNNHHAPAPSHPHPHAPARPAAAATAAPPAPTTYSSSYFSADDDRDESIPAPLSAAMTRLQLALPR